MNKFNQTIMNQVDEKAYASWVKKYGAIDDVPEELLEVATNSIIPLINKGCKKKICIYDLEQVEELYSGSYDVHDDFRPKSELVCLNCDANIFYKEFFTCDKMLLDVVKIVQERKAETERSESNFNGSSLHLSSALGSPGKRSPGKMNALKNTTTLDLEKSQAEEPAKQALVTRQPTAKVEQNFDLTPWKMKLSGIQIPNTSKFSIKEAEDFKELVLHKLSKDKIEIIKENFLFDELKVPLPTPQDLILLCSQERLTHPLNILLLNYWRTKVAHDKYAMCNVFLFEISRETRQFVPSDLASSDMQLVLQNQDFHKILFWMYTPFGNYLIEYDKARKVALHIDILIESTQTTPGERRDFAMRQFDKLVSEVFPGSISVNSRDQTVKMVTKNPNLAIHSFLIDYLFSASQIHLITEINWVILWIVHGFNLIVKKQPIVIKRKPSDYEPKEMAFTFKNEAKLNPIPTVEVSEEGSIIKAEKKKRLKPKIVFHGSMTRNQTPEKKEVRSSSKPQPSPPPKPRKNLVVEQGNMYVPERRTGKDQLGESINHKVENQEKLENLMPLLKFYQRNDPERYEHLVKKAKEDSKADISEAINMFVLQKEKEGGRKHKKTNSNHHEIKRDSIRSVIVAKESSSDKQMKARSSKFNFHSRESSAENKKGLSRFADGQNRAGNKLPDIKSSKRLISNQGGKAEADLPVELFDTMVQVVLARNGEESEQMFIYSTEMMRLLTNQDLSKEDRYDGVGLLSQEDVFESYQKIVCPLAVSDSKKEARYACLVIDNKRRLIESFEPMASLSSLQSSDSLKAVNRYIQFLFKTKNGTGNPPLYLVKKSKLDIEVMASEKTGSQVLYYINFGVSRNKLNWSPEALHEFMESLN